MVLYEKRRLYRGVIGAFLTLFFLCTPQFIPGPTEASETSVEPSKLLVFWTSGDKEVFLKTVYILTYYSKERGWWNEVRFLIWGPSAKLLVEDTEMQQYVEKMKDVGVELITCEACADMYGAPEKLEALGINVYYVGSYLADMLRFPLRCLDKPTEHRSPRNL